MSNIVKKIKANMKTQKKKEDALLYTTPIGTIVSTVGILNGKTEKENVAYMKKLIKEQEENVKFPNTIIDIVNYVWEDYGKGNHSLRADMVLLTDTDNIRSPMISFINNEQIMPLSPEGLAYGILGCALEGRENVNIEYLYDEDGEYDYEEELDNNNCPNCCEEEEYVEEEYE